MTESKRLAKFRLTPEQREIVESVRRRVEAEKPEIIAEGLKTVAADAVTSVQLRGAVSLLKAVRKAQGVTLGEVARRTGMTKTSLSRLENDAEANVTINTLHRIADALGHDVQISVVPRMTPALKTQTRAKASKAGFAAASAKVQ